MNALYVTVSIPLILFLAGFNHAHGLTTFGKSNPQQQPPPQPTFPAKSCTNHTHCRGIDGTSCVPEIHDPLKKSCLCGNNQAPNNGVCSAVKKGPNHTCDDDDNCVKGAQCEMVKTESVKVCKCVENPEFNYECNGSTHVKGISGLTLLFIFVLRFV